MIVRCRAGGGVYLCTDCGVGWEGVNSRSNRSILVVVTEAAVVVTGVVVFFSRLFLPRHK